MAIRFKHDVGAGIIGAFAAGQAKSQQRRQKYALDLIQQERQHQMRMEEQLTPLKYRAGLAGMGGGLPALGGIGGGLGGRGGAIGAPAGEWSDPGAAITDPAERAAFNAKRRDNERRRRLGKPIRNPEVEPVWIPSPTEKDKDRDWRAGQAKAAQDARDKIAKMGDTRAKRQAVEKGLSKIPDHIVGEDRRDLARLLSGIKRMLRDPEHDISDPDTWDALMDAVDKYEDQIAGLPPEDKTDPTFVQDPITGDVRPTRPGEEPQYGMDDKGKQYELPSYARKREEEKANQEQQKKAKEAYQAQRKEMFAEARKRLEAFNDTKGDSEDAKTFADFLREVEDEYRATGISLVPNPDARNIPGSPGYGHSGGAGLGVGGTPVTGDAGIASPQPTGGGAFGMAPKAGVSGDADQSSAVPMGGVTGKGGARINIFLDPGGMATEMNLIQMPGESDEEFAERWRKQGYRVEVEPPQGGPVQPTAPRGHEGVAQFGPSGVQQAGPQQPETPEEAALPHPATPEEARKLHGTYFITPDGRRLWAP